MTKIPFRIMSEHEMKNNHELSKRFCPVCENYSSRFAECGVKPRPDSKCKKCGSRGRHRLIWLYFQRKTNLFDGSEKKILHIAPENCFEPIFRRKLGENYLTADLNNPRAMLKMDITNIQYSDNSFDMIYCSHVLEHVQKDIQAMSEFYRILKPGGSAIIMVPISSEQTFEDPTITDPEERLRIFGQGDHVRRYGVDIIERLERSGFNIIKVSAADFLTHDEITQMRTGKKHPIFHCFKS